MILLIGGSQLQSPIDEAPVTSSEVTFVSNLLEIMNLVQQFWLGRRKIELKIDRCVCQYHNTTHVCDQTSVKECLPGHF